MIFNLNPDEHAMAIRETESLAGYTFQNPALLQEALTHSSFAAESSSKTESNQRLEFLGDAVLQILVSEELFAREKEAQEGVLSRMRSHLVNETANASYARALKLDRILLLGHGECQAKGREKSSILGDLFEAFLGAMYLDAGSRGHEVCRTLLLSLMAPFSDVKESLILDDNPKGSLLNLCQKHKLPAPEYHQISCTGPSHHPLFTVSVHSGARELSTGKGNSLRTAEKLAAHAAYRLLEEELSRTAPLIFALDFDGVLCDSAGETGGSCWKAARKFWPAAFPESLPPPQILADFRRVRPYLETGWQGILLMKMLQEKLPPQEFSENRQAHFDRILSENSLTREACIQALGEARDTWIKQNGKEWLQWNPFYAETATALKTALQLTDRKIYIISTKETRFLLALLELHNIPLPPEQIFGLEYGKKKGAILEELRQQHPKSAILFLEDRVQTLKNVEALDSLKQITLTFAKWGYATASDLLLAQNDPRIQLLEQTEFSEWLTQPAIPLS